MPVKSVLVIFVALTGCQSGIEFSRTNTPDGPATVVDCGRDNLDFCVEAAKDRCHGGFRTLKRTERGTWTEHRGADGDVVRRKERSNSITFVCEHEHDATDD